jgi:transposase
MKRCLASSTTRQLNLWSHFQFRQRLKHKAEELGVRVHETAEPQTSITCTKCLWIEESFCNNSAKRFACHRCGFKIDRDRNGARNILLHNIERHVGRVEPHTPPPPPPPKKPPRAVVVISLLEEAKEEEPLTDDDECAGWMWKKKNKKTTIIG